MSSAGIFLPPAHLLDLNVDEAFISCLRWSVREELGLVQFAVLMIYLHVGVAFAAEPVPFENKVTRQSQHHELRVPAWHAGELVQAPLFSRCEKQLTLTVDPYAPGGLKLYKHSDSFQIEDSPEHLEKIRDWRGMTYTGVLEIIAPLGPSADGENHQIYRARVVSLAPPVSLINPTKFEADRLKQNESAILIGEVVELGDRFMWIETRRRTYFVELRAGVPRLESDLSDTIKNLAPRSPLRVGDHIQLRVYATGRIIRDRSRVSAQDRPNSLRADARHSCYLEYPGRGRLAEYVKERGVIRGLMRMLIDATRAARWETARMIDSSLRTHHLTAVERARLGGVRNFQPADQRALNLTASDHEAIDCFDQTFGVHLGEMTRQSFNDFAEQWARQLVRVSKAGDDLHRQAILLPLLRKAGVPRDAVVNLAITAARHRLSYFQVRADHGLNPEDADFRELINLSEIWWDLAGETHVAAVNYLISTVVSLARLEAQRWTYAGRLIKPALEALRHQISGIEFNRSRAGRSARKIFCQRTEELRAALADLKEGVDLDRPSPRDLNTLRSIIALSCALSDQDSPAG